jgi:hypothetical protein
VVDDSGAVGAYDQGIFKAPAKPKPKKKSSKKKSSKTGKKK